MSVFTVDFGHTKSGGDTGARGNGFVEEDCTREIGNLVINGLRKEGHTVYPIQLDYARTMSESLNYRVDKIIGINPNQSISIHINAAVDPSATGVEVFGDNLCKDKCIRICNNISSQFNLANRGFKNGCADLALVGLYGQSNVPALLVECFFISNANDCKKYNAQKYADAIVAGILNKEINNNETVEEDYVMDYIVQVGNEVDKRCADYLADALKCPVIDANRPFDYSKVKTCIAIGGKPKDLNFSGYTKYHIKGDDRWSTGKRVIQAAEEISRGKSVEEALLQYKL